MPKQIFKKILFNGGNAIGIDESIAGIRRDPASPVDIVWLAQMFVTHEWQRDASHYIAAINVAMVLHELQAGNESAVPDARRANGVEGGGWVQALQQGGQCSAQAMAGNQQAPVVRGKGKIEAASDFRKRSGKPYVHLSTSFP